MTAYGEWNEDIAVWRVSVIRWKQVVNDMTNERKIEICLEKVQLHVPLWSTNGKKRAIHTKQNWLRGKGQKGLWRSRSAGEEERSEKCAAEKKPGRLTGRCVCVCGFVYTIKTARASTKHKGEETTDSAERRALSGLWHRTYREEAGKGAEWVESKGQVNEATRASN